MRADRATRGFAVSLAQSVVTAALGLVLTPLLLRYLGTERLGVLRATAELLAYLALLDMGLTFALPGIFSEAIGKQDRGLVLEGLAAAARVYMCTAIAGVTILIVMALVVPTLFELSADAEWDLRIGVLLACLPAAAARLSPLRNLLEARQAGYLVQLALIAGSMVGFGVAVAAAVSGWGIAGQFLSTSVTLLFTTLLVAGIELRKHPEELAAVLGRVTVSTSVTRRLWSQNIAGLVLNLCGRLAMHSDNIIIGVMLGPAAVVPFFTTQRLIQLALAQTFAVGNTTWAGLADMYHRGEHETLSRRMAELTCYTLVIGLAGIVPSAIWARSFVTIWIGGDYYAGHSVTYLAAAAAICHTLISLWGWAFSGTGHTRLLVPWAIASCLVNITVSIAATAVLGLSGPLVGSVVAFAATTAWWHPWLMRRHLQIDTRSFLPAVLKPAAAAVAYFALPAYLAVHYPIETLSASRWTQLGILAAVLSAAALGYLVVAWFFVLTTNERSEWRKRLPMFRRIAGSPRL